jgi:hypothetical protein
MQSLMLQLRARAPVYRADYPASLIVIVLNLAIATLPATHLLNGFYAERLIANNLGMTGTFSELLRRDWKELLGQALFIILLVIGALLELRRSPIAMLPNLITPIISLVVLAVQLLHYPAPPDATGETGTVIALLGLPILLITVLYGALYWSRLRMLLNNKLSAK